MPIIKYNNANKNQWDRFVAKAKNANFQHYRDYIEYHKDRFTDHSVIYTQDGNVVSLMPANILNNQLCSHHGLTFGGMLTSQNIKQKQVLHFFDLLIAYAQEQRFGQIVLRLQPHIYNRVPSEEIHYALFRNNAVISSRQVSSVIDLGNMLHYGKGRKWSLKKSRANNLTVARSEDFETFMDIEAHLLSGKYGAKPVHTAAEIRYLQQLFPDNIRLYTVNHEGDMVGGVLVYIYDGVVKCQYIGSTERCRKLHGLDTLFHELLTVHFKDYRYFDFGHSTLQDGLYLEDTLIQNKESYGARAICYDTYTINL